MMLKCCFSWKGRNIMTLCNPPRHEAMNEVLSGIVGAELFSKFILCMQLKHTNENIDLDMPTGDLQLVSEIEIVDAVTVQD